MKYLLLSCVSIILLPLAWGGRPTGFEQPGILETLKTGKTVIETPVSTATELVQVTKAYFKDTKAEDYVHLVTNHKKYELMFKDGSPRIMKADTLSVNKEKTEYQYKLLVVVDGPFGVIYEFEPQGRQLVLDDLHSSGETKIDNTLTNYKEQLTHASQTTRIIPYDEGLLIEDRLHIILKQQTQSSAAMKKQLGILSARFLEAFRKELGAGP